MSNFNILHVWLSDYLTLHIEIGALVTFITLFAILLILINTSFGLNPFLKVVELNINLGAIGNVKIKPNHEVKQIAHKAWSELATRKAGLYYDREHDVVVEVYNSWYQLFSEIRSLIKEIPATHLKQDDTKKLANLLVDALNKGMRPHLTKWQAKFRRWYDAEIVKDYNAEKTPQEIQQQYPLYDEMLRELIIINHQLVAYTIEIKKLVD